MKADTGDLQVPRPGRRRGRSVLVAAGLTLITGVVGAGLLATAGPAYADVTSGYYAIGTSSGGVSSVLVSPASVAAGASTHFEVSFTALAGLSATDDNFVIVQPTQSLASAPVNVFLVGGSCLQAGTAGTGGAGSDIAQGLTIEMGGSCSIAAGVTVQVDFTADAPSSTGSFYFTVTTSVSALATSNLVAVGTSAGTLSASTYAYGETATYTISDILVASLTTAFNTVVLTAITVGGNEALSFYNGPSGYTVSFTPSGGSAIADPVEEAVASANTVTLTLASPLVDADTLTITATGTNPAASTSTQANAIDVEVGNAPPILTSTITFGSSVSDVTVSASTTAAGTLATYTVGFRASTAVGVGGYIVLSETAGPTNFSTATGVEVLDTTQGQTYAATPASLADGTATIIVNDTINAGDFITVTLANVTNPPAATISDFKVSTTADDVPAEAAPYSIGAGVSTSSGVAVSVSPATTSTVASYSISNLRASAAMAGGASTIAIDGPAGTLFPNTPGFYNIQDSTTASGSGTVGEIVSGGGTNDVVITVPGTINSGDVLTLNIEDAINPSLASSTYAITLLGNVTGLAATPTTTPTTTSAPPPATPQPAVTTLTATATVAKQAVKLELRCATAKCTGVITLVDLRTELGHGKYNLGAGQTGYATVGLFQQVLPLLAAAKDHTIDATETVTVTGGRTVAKTITVTTNVAAPKPVVAPYTRVAVSGKSVTLELRCSDATCVGTVSLVDLRTELGHAHYDLGAGQTGHVRVDLFQPALALLARAKDHTIDATETVTVTGGKTVATKITLVGQ
ncbi:MAG: hypothetical protein ABSE77_05275 [Acidimicrobiales bacterium]